MATRRKEADLRSELEAAKLGAEEFKRRGRELVKKGTFISELVDGFQPGAQGLEKTDFGRHLAKALHRFNKDATTLDSVSWADLTSSIATVGFAVTGAQSDDQNFLQRISGLDPSKIQFVAELAEQEPTADDVESLIEKLGLQETAVERKSTVQLLREAHTSFDQPSTSGAESTSLLPMRECMHQCAAELLRLRREQERARGTREKILSIGQQLGRAELPRSDFEQIADDWAEAIDELSVAKQALISRRDCRRLLYRARSVLYRLLNSVDPNRLRERKA